jgi:hypothetical protein
MKKTRTSINRSDRLQLTPAGLAAVAPEWAPPSLLTFLLTNEANASRGKTLKLWYIPPEEPHEPIQQPVLIESADLVEQDNAAVFRASLRLLGSHVQVCAAKIAEQMLETGTVRKGVQG